MMEKSADDSVLVLYLAPIHAQMNTCSYKWSKPYYHSSPSHTYNNLPLTQLPHKTAVTCFFTETSQKLQ